MKNLKIDDEREIYIYEGEQYEPGYKWCNGCGYKAVIVSSYINMKLLFRCLCGESGYFGDENSPSESRPEHVIKYTCKNCKWKGEKTEMERKMSGILCPNCRYLFMMR